jgi:hypothetical protein
VEHEYELFERFPNGTLQWRGVARGLIQARLKLEGFARETRNELFAMDLNQHFVAIRLNATVAQQKTIKRLFQIAYDEKLLVMRGEILRAQGYEVTSVIGNETAMTVLGIGEDFDLFVIGHAAPQETRIAMVAWLKARYPKTKIVALNPPECECLAGADYNARQNGYEVWLPTVKAALA